MSTHLTSEERERLVLENIKLVYHVVKKLPHVSPSNFDDLVQIGRVGLIKAASTFDFSRGTKFSTYAGRCINNEINMYFRKVRPHNSDISLNDVVYTDVNGSELELEHILGNEDDFVEEIADDEIMTNTLSIILNILEPKEAISILYKISGVYTQRDIGKVLGVSQSYVSRLKERAEQNIRKYLERKEKLFCPIFSMVKVGDFYHFTCNTKYTSECLLNFLRSEKVKILPHYKVIRNDDSIEFWMPSYSETFVFIAEFIKEISDL